MSDGKRLAESSDKLEPDTVKVVSTGSNGAGRQRCLPATKSEGKMAVRSAQAAAGDGPEVAQLRTVFLPTAFCLLSTRR